MSKHVAIPASRLICFGSAKRLTNAVGQSGTPEEFPGLEYDI